MSGGIHNQINIGSKDKSELPKEKRAPFWISREFIILILALVVVGSAGLISLGKASDTSQTIAGSKTPAVPVPRETTKLDSLERELENKLQTALSRMNGVGQVEVSVSLSSGLKSNYARNENVTKRTSKETDKASGTRETTEVIDNNQLVMPNGTTQPVMVMEERPEVAGVLVIAEGAKDPMVKETIHTAIKTLLNIPANKITVEPMGGV